MQARPRDLPGDEHQIDHDADDRVCNNAQTVRMNQMLAQPRSQADVFQDIAFALAILVAPITYCLGGVLDPIVHVVDGTSNIAAYASANPYTNGLHLASFVLGSFVLPISIIGIARLLMPRSPWFATIGGGLGLLGWLPFSALTAQEDLTLQMARLGGDTQLLGALWERFNADATMTLFLVVYIAAHLAAYVVLAIGLYRARLIPAWAAWTLGSSTPLVLAFFATRQRSEVLGLAFELAFMATFIIGSVPVGRAALHKGAEFERRCGT
jgi:hypothetical protein